MDPKHEVTEEMGGAVDSSDKQALPLEEIDSFTANEAPSTCQIKSEDISLTSIDSDGFVSNVDSKVASDLATDVAKTEITSSKDSSNGNLKLKVALNTLKVTSTRPEGTKQQEKVLNKPCSQYEQQSMKRPLLSEQQAMLSSSTIEVTSEGLPGSIKEEQIPSELHLPKPQVPSFFPKLKQEGRAKMSAPSKGDPKQNEALLKLVMSKESNTGSLMMKPVSSDQVGRPKALGMSMTKMANLKNILNSVMKTSISQVIRTKIDSKTEGKSNAEDLPSTSSSSMTEGKDTTAKRIETEKTLDILKHNVAGGIEEGTNNFKDSLKDIAPHIAPRKSCSSAMDTTKSLHTGSNRARKSLPSWTVKMQPKTDMCKTSNSPLQPVVLTRNQAARKAMRPKKPKKKHFRGATYGLYLSTAKKKKRSIKRFDSAGGIKDEESSVTGTETTGSFLDSEDEEEAEDKDSFISEGYTPSELSFQDEELSSEQSNISPSPSCKAIMDSSYEEKLTIDQTNSKIDELEKSASLNEGIDDDILKGQLDIKEENVDDVNSDVEKIQNNLTNSDANMVCGDEEVKDDTIEGEKDIIGDSVEVEADDKSCKVENLQQRIELPGTHTMEDAAMVPAEEANVPDVNSPSKPDELDMLGDKTVIEETVIGEQECTIPKEKMECEETVHSEGSSSIATIVKSRVRIKRRNTDDAIDVPWRNDDAVSIASSVSAGSDSQAPYAKKPKKVHTASFPSVTTDGDFLPKVDVVYQSKLPPLTKCTCIQKPLESVSNRIPECKIYCQALDSIDGKLVGCCNFVSNEKLVRASVRIPFAAMCEVHLWRLRHHHCCPGCGIFCTQGNFLQCVVTKDDRRYVHLFHKRCQMSQDDGHPLLCLHCGAASTFRSVCLELNMPTAPTFYLTQKPTLTDIPKAKMTFSRLAEADEAENDVLPSRSFTVPETGKILSSAGLPLGPDRVQLEALLVSLATEKSLSPRYNTENLYEPAKDGDVDKVLNMLATGSDADEKFEEHDNETALHAAATGGHLVVVHLLVQAGALLDHMDDHLCTPLMLAVEKKQLPVVQYLIKAGSQLDCRGEEGMTALHLASRCGSVETCKMILDTGRINVNIQDEGGWTPIVWASEHKHIDVIRLLLERGADPNIRDNEGNIALHWSAFSGSIEISQIYLDIGCDMSAQNEHGDTPLHISARQDNYECVVLFLARGADIEIRNKENETPLNCCPDQSSQTWMALSMNQELKRLTANRVCKSERILHKDISRGKELNPIQCVNGIDAEPAPTDFLYITENCETSPIHIDRTITSLQSCRCEDDCTSPNCTCATISFKCWYDKEGHLLPEFSMLDPPMIFECNRSCLCWKNCNNRVLQHGVTSRLQLFRTKGKGWGVRALKDIPKGSFICEYIGEIISDSEADQREDDSYLFDLDNRDGETFCLDARYYGNISRFINHLCEPNLVPVKIFVDHQDLSFPRIAFFSSRDINALEELGFDYGEKFWVIKYKWFTCGCGSPKCKYSRETIHETLANYYRRMKEDQGDEMEVVQTIC